MLLFASCCAEHSITEHTNTNINILILSLFSFSFGFDLSSSMAGDIGRALPPPDSEEFSTLFNQLLHNSPPLGMDPNHSPSDFTPHNTTININSNNNNNTVPSSPSNFNFSDPHHYIPASDATTFKQHTPDFTSFSVEVPLLSLSNSFYASPQKKCFITSTHPFNPTLQFKYQN